jgi:restriction endonuclease S subunit
MFETEHEFGEHQFDATKEFPVILPPLCEQTAIAGLLSTWDMAIEKIERLIQRKQKLKSEHLRVLINGNRPNATIGTLPDQKRG